MKMVFANGIKVMISHKKIDLIAEDIMRSKTKNLLLQPIEKQWTENKLSIPKDKIFIYKGKPTKRKNKDEAKQDSVEKLTK